MCHELFSIEPLLLSVNPFTTVNATDAYRFYSVNARRFYSSMGNPLRVKGLTATVSPCV